MNRFNILYLLDLQGCDYGPKLNFIGNFEGENCPGYYVDKEERVEPADLFTAQKRRRRM